MVFVVFMRGVNVGGRKKFQPSRLANDLREWDAVSIGAAGTLVVRHATNQTALREAVRDRLPFEAELMICRATEIIRLVKRDPFARIAADARPFVTVLAERPEKEPVLPHYQPPNERWAVQVIEITDRFALSISRKIGRTAPYPNEVVERLLGIAATTRSWNTIEAIHNVLAES